MLNVNVFLMNVVFFYTSLSKIHSNSTTKVVLLLFYISFYSI